VIMRVLSLFASPVSKNRAMLNIFRKKPSSEWLIADKLYMQSVSQARLPYFYEKGGVADTPDGRFDMIMLHVYLILRRFRRAPEKTQLIGQALFDRMFVDIDQNLREMGAGDIGVAYRVKDMAKAFYGRIAAYDEGLDGENDACLANALRRNLFRKTLPHDRDVRAMAEYVREQVLSLDKQGTLEILESQNVFSSDGVSK